jgi:site-specific DNA-methyltransferase (cytosine-N4-specific)
MQSHWYFKLFNSIKEEHEVDFAELELLSLFGSVERVRNFADILYNTSFKHFTGNIRIQDFFAHELPYGRFQGFYAKRNGVFNVSLLVKRLAYTREFFVVVPFEDPEILLQKMFPSGEIDRNVQYFKSGDHSLLRFITNQYFLEKSEYISKVSRNEKEVDNNVEALFAFLTKQMYRIPATVTMRVGKRLEDYFTIREEPSLHLTHYMHPYKGRFHPKMVRALLNYVYPKEQGLVMDNLAGCGTLLVEATWMGLNSIGVEINPLSVLMSNVKCDSLGFSPEELKKAIEIYLRELKEILLCYEKQSAGSRLLFAPKYDRATIEKRKKGIPDRVISLFRGTGTINKILIAHELIKKIDDERIRNFLLLALSGAISDLTRRRHGEFFEVLFDRLKDLYLRIYIFRRLNQTLKIKLGKSKTYVADAREMKMIKSESIDAIVNSPPYSTALDYIRNDYPQLTILGLAEISSLEKNMIGNPNLKVYSTSLFEEMKDNNVEYSRMPANAKEVITTLKRYGRRKEALRTYKFFKDMHLALEEMYRVMKNGSKCVIIIGNNHYKIDRNYVVEVKNDEVLKEMALAIGFKEDKTITRELEKTRAGMIRYESILILQKTSLSE